MPAPARTTNKQHQHSTSNNTNHQPPTTNINTLIAPSSPLKSHISLITRSVCYLGIPIGMLYGMVQYGMVQYGMGWDVHHSAVRQQ